MQAVILARAAIAILHDGHTWYLMQYDAPDVLVPCDEAKAQALRKTHETEVWINDVSLDEVRNRLADVVDCIEALDCVLFLLDKRLESKSREAVAREFEELACIAEIIQSIECTLLAAPLPASADIEGAIQACIRTESYRATQLFYHWDSLQPSVNAVCNAWKCIRWDIVGGVQQNLQGIFIGYGIFAELARIASVPDGLTNFDKTVILTTEVQKAVPNSGLIIEEWLHHLTSTQIVQYKNTPGLEAAISIRTNDNTDEPQANHPSQDEVKNSSQPEVSQASRSIDPRMRSLRQEINTGNFQAYKDIFVNFGPSGESTTPPYKIGVSSPLRAATVDDLVRELKELKDNDVKFVNVRRQQISRIGKDTLREVLAERGLAVNAIGFAGGFTGSLGMTYERSVDDTKRSIELAAALGARYLIVVPGEQGLHTYNHAERRIRMALTEVLYLAIERNIRLLIPVDPKVLSVSGVFIPRTPMTQWITRLGSSFVQPLFSGSGERIEYAWLPHLQRGASIRIMYRDRVIKDEHDFINELQSAIISNDNSDGVVNFLTE